MEVGVFQPAIPKPLSRMRRTSGMLQHFRRIQPPVVVETRIEPTAAGIVWAIFALRGQPGNLELSSICR
jgi:hypothetical protein